MANKSAVEIIISAKDQASGVFSSLSAKLGAVATAVAGYFGATFFAGAVRGAADLEEAMSRVQAASAASAQELGELKQAAVDAGASTKFTATEAAGALEELVKSGLSAKDAIGALPAVLNLAQAGGVGLAEASSTLTQVVAGLGMQMGDAGRIADVLAMGANASKTSVNGLSQALSYAAPVANAAKLSLEQTVAILGKFADGSIDASRAGTALNAILSQFIDPASNFRKELAGVGIVTSDFNLALRQLAAAGPAGQQAILAVGTEAGPALRALLNQGIGALDELKGKLDNAGGSAAEAAAVMQGNLNGALGGLSSAWDSLKIALGEPVLPVLTDGVKQLTASIGAAVSNGTIGQFGTSIATAFKSAIEWVKGFVAAVDFKVIAAQLQSFAVTTGETLKRLGEQATNAGDLVKLAFGVMAGGVNVVLAGIYKLGEVFATVAVGIQNGLALIYEGFAKVTFGELSRQYAQIATEIRASSAATAASAQAMGEKSSAAFDAAAKAGSLASTAYKALSSAATASVPPQNASAAAIQNVANQLQKLSEQAPAAAQKQIEAATKTREAIAQLKREYEAAIAAGDIQLAAQKQQQLRDELKKTQAAAKFSADELKVIFSGLGIVSQASLQQAATAAQTLFDQLKASGQATAFDLQNAFAVVAQKTLEASGAIGSAARSAAEAALSAKAAANGLSLEFDAAGKVIVRAMGEGADAARNLGEAATEAGKATETAADKATRALERQREASEKAAEAERKRLNVDKEGFSLDSSGSRLVATESQEQLNKRVGNQYGNDFANDDRAIRASNIKLQLDQIRAGKVTSANTADITALIAELARLEAEIEKAKQDAAKARKEEADKKSASTADKAAEGRTYSAPAPSPAPAPAPSTVTYRVQVELPSGKGGSFNAASDTDARAAASLIGMLVNAKSAAGY